MNVDKHENSDKGLRHKFRIIEASYDLMPDVKDVIGMGDEISIV